MTALVGRCLRVVLAAAVIAAASPARVESPTPPRELNAANLAAVIDPAMTDWIEKRSGAGAVVSVVTRNEMVFAKGYGLADRDTKRPFTPDTLVRGGSISKLFTAIAVMQLVDAGKLDLDRDVNQYIDFVIPTPGGGVPVTLRRLLTHRAGFEEHIKGLFSRGPEPEGLGDWVRKSLPPRLFPKGDVEAYSNYGFALAGHIVERASGEPFAQYVQGHILDPLGMTQSTFIQPLPAALAPLMAKGYSASDRPPLPFFETIIAPPGAVSVTAQDMGRFMRALLNGGELDGVRILPKVRLEEMMAPAHATPAGYLGLAFWGGDIDGRRTIGHGGATITFFSDLQIFPDAGVGVFVARNGFGKLTALEDLFTLPDPVALVARQFLPDRAQPPATVTTTAANAAAAGVYHFSRRAESTLLRMQEFQSQAVIGFDGEGNVKTAAAVFPFKDGLAYKRIGPNLYQGPAHVRITLVEGAGGETSFALPSLVMQRVPWWLDLRWITPLFVVSVLIVAISLLAWPVAALRRRWRKSHWSKAPTARRWHLAVRLVLVVDAAVLIATGLLFAKGAVDFSIFNEALDPALLGLYALAWLGVIGSAIAIWAAIAFWRTGIGGRWARIHHTMLAASCLMLAWFFVTFRIAGTTLNY